MRTIIFAALCLAGGWAMADQAVVKVYSLSVQERLQNLELIDVTAQKQTPPDAMALDADLADILREVEALERNAADEEE